MTLPTPDAATVCPRCAYTRQASDTAPDWQCPRCGVAYAKAQAVVQQAVPAAGLPSRPVASGPARAKKSTRWLALAIGLVLGGLGLVFVFLKGGGSAPVSVPKVESANLGTSTSSLWSDVEKGFATRQYELAVSKLRRLAHDGHARAMVWLYLLYREGNAVPQNLILADEWLDKAVALNDPLAFLHKGAIYAAGRDGFPQEPATARYWFRKAAKAGEGAGLFLLGRIYEQGFGVMEDLVKADALYLMAVSAHQQKAERQPYLYPQNQTAEAAIGAAASLDARLEPGQFQQARRLVETWKADPEALIQAVE